MATTAQRLTALEKADVALGARITTEVNARSAAVNSLDARIDTLEAQMANVILRVGALEAHFEPPAPPDPPMPIASFTASPTSGVSPLTVVFTDTSSGTPTSWAWTFGDGATSSEQSPTHVYTGAASRTASLTVTNATGSSGPVSRVISVFASPPVPPPPNRPFAPPVTTQTVNVPGSIDATGATDVSTALNSFIGTVPDGSIISFPAGATYKIGRCINLQDCHDLVFEGNGAMLRAIGSSGSMWSSNFVLYGTPTSVHDVVIHGFILEGGNPNTGEDIYTPGAENQHGVGVYGAARVEVANCTIRKTWGDAIYLENGSAPSEWASDVWVHDNTITDIGRQTFTIIAGRNALFERNTLDRLGNAFFDIEPDVDTQGADNIVVRNNTIGSWGISRWGGAYFASAANYGSGQNANVNRITVTGNTVSAGSSYAGGLRTWFGRPSRMSGISVTNNSTTKAGDGPVMRFEHLDGLTVTGNTQPLTSGSLVSVTDCTNVVTSPNP